MIPCFFTLPFLKWFDLATPDAYHDARFEKDTRYYVIRLHKDLLDDWVITLINGRIKTKLGQSRTIAFEHFNDGFHNFCSFVTIRAQRGYQLKTIASDNPLLMHLIVFLVTAQVKTELTPSKKINQRQLKDLKPSSNSKYVQAEPTAQQMGFAF